MKVSIIVPIYNVEPYIRRCLLSVMNQTYSDIECILVDDCGADKSMNIATEMIANYEGPIIFKVLHHQYNRGLSAARNTGTTQASGEYVYYLDSDDELTPCCISSMVNTLDASDKVDIVCGTTQTNPYKKGYEIKQFKDIPLFLGNRSVRKAAFSNRKSIPVSAWNKLIRRNFLEENAITFKEGLLYEDHLWWYHCARNANVLTFCFDESYIHYNSPNSIMANSNQKKLSENIVIMIKEILPLLNEPFLKPQLCKYSNLLLTGYSSEMTEYHSCFKIMGAKLKDSGYYLMSYLLLQYERISQNVSKRLYKKCLYYMFRTLQII